MDKTVTPFLCASQRKDFIALPAQETKSFGIITCIWEDVLSQTNGPLALMYELLLKVQRFILILTSLTVVGIICAAVFMRYVLHKDLFAYDELVMIAAFWLYFIGAAYGSYEDSHIKADIIQISLSTNHPKAAAVIGLIARGLELFLTITISVWAWSLISWQFKFMGHTMGWGIPIAVPQGAIFIGFVLMAFYALIHFVKELMLLISGKYKDAALQGD